MSIQILSFIVLGWVGLNCLIGLGWIVWLSDWVGLECLYRALWLNYPSNLWVGWFNWVGLEIACCALAADSSWVSLLGWCCWVGLSGIGVLLFSSYFSCFSLQLSYPWCFKCFLFFFLSLIFSGVFFSGGIGVAALLGLEYLFTLSAQTDSSNGLIWLGWSIWMGCRLRVVRWLLFSPSYLCSGGVVKWVCLGLVCSYSPRIFYAFLFNSPIRGVLNVFSSFFSLQQFLYPWYWCGCSSRPCFP